MTDSFGHSDNLITLSLSLSLSLSLRRSPIREVTTPFILRARRPRQYTAFLVFTQEKSACFFVPAGRRRGRRQALRYSKNFIFTISLTSNRDYENKFTLFSYPHAFGGGTGN